MLLLKYSPITDYDKVSEELEELFKQEAYEVYMDTVKDFTQIDLRDKEENDAWKDL